MRPPLTGWTFDELHEGLSRARAIRLEHQACLSDREAEAFALVGAQRAAKHWRKRAARLRARLSRLS